LRIYKLNLKQRLQILERELAKDAPMRVVIIRSHENEAEKIAEATALHGNENLMIVRIVRAVKPDTN